MNGIAHALEKSGRPRHPAAPVQSDIVVSVRAAMGAPEVRVDAPGRPGFERFALGKRPDEAARLSGLIYNLCAAAQEGAARAALGLPPAPETGLRIARESLRDHALQMAATWPRVLGQTPDRAAMAGVAALPADDGASLSAALFGPGGAPRRIDEFEDWMAAGRSAAARALHHVWTRWDSRWARAALPLWRIGAPVHDIDFAAAEIDGGPVDASTAARVADHTLMREISVRRGRGLIWRMAGRLVDAARLLDDLPHGAPREAPERLAEGLGAANAARGALLVRAETNRGLVSFFARLTPTDFALHPHGALDRAMAGLPTRGRAPLARVAALTLESIDPCSPHRVVFDA